MGVKREEKTEEKAYTYDEAIELAGSGWYNIGLLLTLSLAFLAMCIDMFSLSVVVTLSSCDFELDITQKSILMSMPFLGPVVTAYAWGYISDTQGRKRSLFISMSVSFVMSTLCAFSPNWIVLAILRLIGTCFCSCAQSASFTLLGESCSNKVKGPYMLVMSSTMHLTAPSYFALAYFIGNMEFSYDLGYITFVPWRLLVLILALPLGITAICITFFYESPKFLLNAGQEDKALEVLKCISRRNGVNEESFKVNKLVLNEDGNLKRNDGQLLQSLWEQTAPLFKPPLLLKTMLLFYLIGVVYATHSSLYLWLPLLTNAFTAGDNLASIGNQSSSLCSIMSQTAKNTNTINSCVSTIDVTLVYATLATGSTYGTLNVLMSKLASRKRAMLLAIQFVGGVSCLAITSIPNKISTFFYLGVLSSSLGMGPLFSYCVDLYPTSFRGMAACLGVMAARISSVIGVNLVGPFMTSHCNILFYCLAALLFSGVAVSCFLPPDRPKKEQR